jgi:hypothetical protein
LFPSEFDGAPLPLRIVLGAALSAMRPAFDSADFVVVDLLKPAAKEALM